MGQPREDAREPETRPKQEQARSKILGRIKKTQLTFMEDIQHMCTISFTPAQPEHLYLTGEGTGVQSPGHPALTEERELGSSLKSLEAPSCCFFISWIWRETFPGVLAVKNPPANEGDLRSIPGSGRSPGEGNVNPLQYSYLENPMDRGVWQATVHGVAESDMTESLRVHTYIYTSSLLLMWAASFNLVWYVQTWSCSHFKLHSLWQMFIWRLWNRQIFSTYPCPFNTMWF